MSECVQCGYCCTVSACGFGAWDVRRKQCVFLTDDSRCRKYEEIKSNPESGVSPAFGAGCSSPMFNERRDMAVERRKRK